MQAQRAQAWATDDLVKNNFSWDLTIPNVAPGNYVIRHEIIALHAAGQVNGAQSYPQCVNFKVEGSGTTKLSGGVPATSFYKVCCQFPIMPDGERRG
jgi:cellulase